MNKQIFNDFICYCTVIAVTFLGIQLTAYGLFSDTETGIFLGFLAILVAGLYVSLIIELMMKNETFFKHKKHDLMKVKVYFPPDEDPPPLMITCYSKNIERMRTCH